MKSLPVRMNTGRILSKGPWAIADRWEGDVGPLQGSATGAHILSVWPGESKRSVMEKDNRVLTPAIAVIRPWSKVSQLV